MTNEKIKIIYEVFNDDFEGRINITIQDVIVNYSDFKKTINALAEDSDGETSYTPICAYGVESKSRYNINIERL